ncbi:phage tail sheath subtilisin-like domain-containing protein [Hungatella sp.]|uniref:phage tail sheath family protein n=1 Tax=Hungatella sp. TaxID=2613924 RepID=UPI002A7EE2FC|nr:phage tail sheath subtilisin-like domain-containing protein [Hungatella sp.]
MAEYLSPGVYVEEFDSRVEPVEGVSTSIAGFIGVAEKGPVGSVPRMATNLSDFKRIYGTYLSEREAGNYRFLAYAVEHFFINGGSRCFVTRVAPADASCAQGAVPNTGESVLKFKASNPGAWGNGLNIVISPSSKARTQVIDVLEAAEGKRYSVKNSAGFFDGDIVAFSDGNTTVYNRVVESKDNVISFEHEFEVDVTDKNLLPDKIISTCEFGLEVRSGDSVEIYENLSFNSNIPQFVEAQVSKSDLICVEYVGKGKEELRPPFECLASSAQDTVTVKLSGGTNGNILNMEASDFIGNDNGAGNRTGIQAFLDNDMVSVIAVPGVTDQKVQRSLTAQCERKNRFAVLDIPREAKAVQDIIRHRENLDTSYAAFYHPWVMVFDPLDKKNIAIPPSGSVMGIYARSDNSRGVHKAPANEVVRACVGLDVQFDKGEQDILNPKGVNLIRRFPGQGIRVWGARTAGSDGTWKYINVRRLFIFLEESIKKNTDWVVFEENNEELWRRVQRIIEVFLREVWRSGGLAGSSPEEAFYVNIGRDTMTQEEIDNGQLICIIGVAPVKPAEFIIFRITQNTASAQ